MRFAASRGLSRRGKNERKEFFFSFLPRRELPRRERPLLAGNACGSLEDRKRSAIGSIFVEIDQLAWVGGLCVMIGHALWIVALQGDSCS